SSTDTRQPFGYMATRIIVFRISLGRLGWSQIRWAIRTNPRRDNSIHVWWLMSSCGDGSGFAKAATVCAPFAHMCGPGESLRRQKLRESGESYPGAIYLGPRIIAIHSLAILNGRSATPCIRRVDSQLSTTMQIQPDSNP